MSSQAAPSAPLGVRRLSPLVLAGALIVVLAVAATAIISLIRTNTDTKDASGAVRPSTAHTAAASRQPSASATGTPTTPAALSSARAAALSWALDNLSSTTPILAPEAVGQQLRTNGFTAVRPLTAATTSVAQRSWILTEPGAAGADRLTAISALVARFGPAGHQVLARYAQPGWTPAAMRSMVSEDRTNRVTAGGALADNQAVHMTSTVRAQLRSGALDYRAATFLALLSNETVVTVTALRPDPAESVAGRPARSLTIRADQPAQLTTALAALPNSYRPTSVGAGHSATTLTWPVAVDPVQPVR